MLGFADMDEMMDAFYQQQLVENQWRWREQTRKFVLMHAVSQSHFEISPAFLEHMTLQRWEQREKPLYLAQGLSQDLVDDARDFFLQQESILKEVSIDAACALVAEAIARQKGLDVSPEEMGRLVGPMLDLLEVEETDAVVESLKTHPSVIQAYMQGRMEKAMTFLYSQATLICEGEVIKTPEMATA